MVASSEGPAGGSVVAPQAISSNRLRRIVKRRFFIFASSTASTISYPQLLVKALFFSGLGVGDSVGDAAAGKWVAAFQGVEQRLDGRGAFEE